MKKFIAGMVTMGLLLFFSIYILDKENDKLRAEAEQNKKLQQTIDENQRQIELDSLQILLEQP